jgi:hypothetical protein
MDPTEEIALGLLGPSGAMQHAVYSQARSPPPPPPMSKTGYSGAVGYTRGGGSVLGNREKRGTLRSGSIEPSAYCHRTHII